MISLFFSLLPFLSLAHAAPDPELVKATLEALPNCSNFVRFDDQAVYLGFGIYRHAFEEPRQAIPGRLTVAPLGHADQAFSLSTHDAALDATRAGDSLFVLTYSGIEEWSMSQRTLLGTFPTTTVIPPLAYEQHPQAFARLGNRLVIAHGRLGVSFFDLTTRKVTGEQRLAMAQSPLESMATGVTVSGDKAYLVLTNFSLVQNGKPAFRGIAVVDMPEQRVLSELDGMDPGADAIVSDGKSAIVSFEGIPIWKYSLASLEGRALPEPVARIWRFPRAGTPTGSPALDDKYYYTCFHAASTQPHGPYRSIPLALNRAVLGLE